MKQGGDENRKMALKLLEESAKEGFGTDAKDGRDCYRNIAM